MPILNQAKCRCGARRDRPQLRCRKCQYRATWYRRKAWRTRKLSNRHGGNQS
jgi:hypothetical protein